MASTAIGGQCPLSVFAGVQVIDSYTPAVTQRSGTAGASIDSPPGDAVAEAPSRRTAAVGWLHQQRDALLGALVTLVAAVVLFTRFSLNDALERDESIYVYGSVRFAHGTPPYTSIFDPKTPGTTLLGGFAAKFAMWIHHDPFHMIRAEFFVISVLAVLAVYLLAFELTASVAASVTAGVTFCCYARFAADALGGPDPKTAGVLCMVVCMWLLLRRRWFGAGIAGGLAFLFWQPLMWFPLIAVVAGFLYAERRRSAVLRALGGALFPIAVVAIYFAVAGAFSTFVDAAFVYPLTGTAHSPESFGAHFTTIVRVLAIYPLTAVIFWFGTACLVVAIVLRARAGSIREVLRSPLFVIVAATFVLNLLYALYDFQFTPDTLPFMPYPVIGIAVLVADLRARADSAAGRRAVAAAGVALAVVAATLAGFKYHEPADENATLVGQLRNACGLNRVIGHGHFVELGDPAQLVLTKRVNPSNYIYLSAGVDQWKIDHTRDGLHGWFNQILARHPQVIGLQGWRSPVTDQMRELLRGAGYVRRYIGPWRVYVTAKARARSRAVDVQLTTQRQPVATDRSFRLLPANGRCRPPARG